MNDDKEKWIEEVFQSMKGSQRAKPSAALFTAIEDRITVSKNKVVPLHPWWYAAAAAIVIFVNATAVFFYNQQGEVSSENSGVTEAYSQPLISTYQIYE